MVLTGGPCGGKTTGQARLSTFFENLGWKVYRLVLLVVVVMVVVVMVMMVVVVMVLY